jgi:anti-sigma B factor antagonist
LSQDIPVFEISSQVSDGFCVVRVAGELDMAHEEDLRGELQRALEREQEGIVVDLSDCEFIDSSGIRSLLVGREAQQGADRGKRGLAVAAANEQIVRIFSVMGIDEAIPVRPTVEEAIAELRR